MTRTLRLILWPAVITLAVTVLRVVGERKGWPSAFFNREAGGAFALVGIAWLVLIFGAWFGARLSQRGQGPRHLGQVALWAVLGIATAAGIFFATAQVLKGFRGLTAVGFAGCLAGAWVAARGWPELARTLAAYGLAARVPVVVVTALAIRGRWGTHYDAIPPNGAELAQFGDWERIFWTGVLPQLTLWIAFTVIVGMLAGAVGAALGGRRR
jgi:hypothetical protein